MIIDDEEEIQPQSEESLADLLCNVISEKKINISLKKEIRCLEIVLQQFLAINPISDYSRSFLLSEISSKEELIKPMLPDKQLETIYLLDGMNGKKRKKVKAVEKTRKGNREHNKKTKKISRDTNS